MNSEHLLVFVSWGGLVFLFLGGSRLLGGGLWGGLLIVAILILVVVLFFLIVVGPSPLLISQGKRPKAKRCRFALGK